MSKGRGGTGPPVDVGDRSAGRRSRPGVIVSISLIYQASSPKDEVTKRGDAERWNRWR